MTKKSRNTRENEFDSPMRRAIETLHSTIEGIALEKPEHSFASRGATSIESLRHTSQVLDPEMPKATKSLVKAVLERTGLFAYSKFKPTVDPVQARNFKGQLLDTPFAYRSVSVTTQDAHIDLLDVSVADWANIPAHQRMRRTYTAVVSDTPDADGLVRSSSLLTTQFSARKLRPDINLETTYTTEEEWEYNKMLTQQAFRSEETTDVILGSPSDALLTSVDPFIRNHQLAINEAQKNHAVSKNLGLLTPSAFDILELRDYIKELFD